MNVVTVSGYLSRPPEIRYGYGGEATASFGIGVHEEMLIDGEHRCETNFHEVVMVGELAENVALSLNEGDPVVVVGRLVTRSWTTEKGRVKTRTEIVAQDVAASLTETMVWIGDRCECGETCNAG